MTFEEFSTELDRRVAAFKAQWPILAQDEPDFYPMTFPGEADWWEQFELSHEHL